MKTQKTQPGTLIEAIQFFSNEDIAIQFVAEIRWPNAAKCPTCGRTDVTYLNKHRRWQCKSAHPRRQFSVKVGTIFEDSAVPLGKWLITLWMEVNSKNAVSSHEVGRAIGVTQKTAWFMLHRIRLALQRGSLAKMRGQAEIDETFVGGLARNMHGGKRRPQGRGRISKTVVTCLLQRHGEVRRRVVENTPGKTLQPHVRADVERGSHTYNDALASYDGLNDEYVHQVVDRAECYAKGRVHTNGLENFWSLFRRRIHGTHVSVEPFHLFRYLDSETFRFNDRKVNDGRRFALCIGGISGRPLTYKELMGETKGVL
jgi:transposase-like protein